MLAILFSRLSYIAVGAIIIWSIRLSAENDKLRHKGDKMKSDLVDFEVDNRNLKDQVDRLLDNVTQLAAERRVRDSHGRFAKNKRVEV